MTYIAFTGHRPEKIGGYDINSDARRRVRHVLRNVTLDGLVIEGAITGGALGVDQDAAMAMSDRGIPYIVAAPCRRQWARWPQASRDLYQQICEDADWKMLEQIITDQGIGGLVYKNIRMAQRDGVIYTYDGEYPGPWVMQRRNEWMVDKCDHLFALWDGTERGGTYNCIRYAVKTGKPWTNLWDQLGF